jgi:hypothetical protein
MKSLGPSSPPPPTPTRATGAPGASVVSLRLRRTRHLLAGAHSGGGGGELADEEARVERMRQEEFEERAGYSWPERP